MSDGSQVVALSARLFRARKIKGKIGGVEQSLPACFSCVFGWAWQSISGSPFPFLESKLPRPEFRLFPLLVSSIHAGRHSLLLTASPPLLFIRGRKEGAWRSELRIGGKKERKEWDGSGSKRGGQVLDRLPDRDPGFFQRLGGGEQSRVSFRSVSWLGSDQMVYSRWNWKWVRVKLPARNFAEGADYFSLFLGAGIG